VSCGHGLLFSYAGSAGTLPALCPNGNETTENPKGLGWEYQSAAANPAGASRLQSLPPARRVAELGSFGDMSYDLQTIEHACLQHRMRFRRCGDCELEVDLAPHGTLVFANTDGGSDTYLGFRDLPWHSHGKLILMTGDATYLEYEPKDLIEGLAVGDVLVVSQYVRGKLRDRWLTHREEKFDLQYIEPDEELRVCRIAEFGAPPNGGPAEPLGNPDAGGGPPSVS